MKKLPGIIIYILLFAGAAAAESFCGWDGLLGLGIEEASDAAGVEPVSVGSSLFMLEDGVFASVESGSIRQLYFSESFGRESRGLFIGMEQGEITSILGEYWIASGDSIYYNLPWKGFPVRLRLVVRDGLLSGAYLYRSDF